MLQRLLLLIVVAYSQRRRQVLLLKFEGQTEERSIPTRAMRITGFHRRHHIPKMLIIHYRMIFVNRFSQDKVRVHLVLWVPQFVGHYDHLQHWSKWLLGEGAQLISML